MGFAPDVQSSFPALKSLLIAVMLVGEWLTAHKKLESHIVWFAYNVLAIFWHLSIDSAFWTKYVVYLFFCLYGYVDWYKRYVIAKKHNNATV